MRRFFGLVLAIGLAACGGGGSGGNGPVVQPGPAPVTSVRSAMDGGIARGLDGIWVYVQQGGAAASFDAAGIEDRGTRAPARTTSAFKIASISKMFIAAACVRAASHGTIRLDDTVAFWLPSLAGRIANADRITLRHLLRHRSGVPDFDSQPGFSWQREYADVDALLAFVLDKPADFEPDARYEYSNTNYVLLGRILDTALGYSHHDFVASEITVPLGMTNTWSLLEDVQGTTLARGYWDGIDRTEQDYVGPGGSMVSTAADVGAFLRALADGTLLDAGEQAAWTSLFGTAIGHSGWLPGYQSLAYYHRDIDTVVVQLVNTTGGGSEAVAQSVHDSIINFLRSR